MKRIRTWVGGLLFATILAFSANGAAAIGSCASGQKEAVATRQSNGSYTYSGNALGVWGYVTVSQAFGSDGHLWQLAQGTAYGSTFRNVKHIYYQLTGPGAGGQAFNSQTGYIQNDATARGPWAQVKVCFG